jgi:hypothetical protein
LRTYKPEKYTEDKKEALLRDYDYLIRIEERALRFAPLDVDWKNADFQLKLVDRTNIDIHHYFYNVISSFPNNRNDAVGSRWLYNLWENNSKKIVGVLRISNDFLRLGPRDEYLGIDTSVYKKGTQYTMQLKGVIPMPGFSQLAGGKLLTALAFSNKVIGDIQKKQDIAGISVCSIWGESIIYDRIPYIKFLGETKKGTGVYFGATAANSKAFMQGKEKFLVYLDRPTDSILNWWWPLYLRRLEKGIPKVNEDKFRVSKKVNPTFPVFSLW